MPISSARWAMMLRIPTGHSYVLRSMPSSARTLAFSLVEYTEMGRVCGTSASSAPSSTTPSTPAARAASSTSAVNAVQCLDGSTPSRRWMLPPLSPLTPSCASAARSCAGRRGSFGP